MTRQERNERQRTNSATSFHSLSASRYGSEPVVPTLSSQGGTSRNPINVPSRPRNGTGRVERDNNISPGSQGAFQQSPPQSPPKPPPAPAVNFNHRRELGDALQSHVVMRQTPPPATPSPSNSGGPSFLNTSIFDTQENPFLPSPNRPGTAPTAANSSTHYTQDSYFPSDETRRPSVASVVTNASSTGSKSSMGRSFYKKLFGDGDTGESPGSVDTGTASNFNARSFVGFGRPTTPTSSRPRTPVPPSESQDNLLHDGRSQDDSSHHHRSHHWGRGRKGKEKHLNKELPPAPLSKEGLSDYRKTLKLHLDGTASSGSSTRLMRSSSPTPSMASVMSNQAAPRSPNDPHTKKGTWGVFNKVFSSKGSKNKEIDQERAVEAPAKRPPNLRTKSSEPLLIRSQMTPMITKRGSGSHTHEYLNPRMADYISVEQLTAAKGPGKEGRNRGGRRGKGGSVVGVGQEDTEMNNFSIDTDFSNIDEFVKRPATPPGPSQLWVDNTDTQPNTAPTWVAPESWGAQGLQSPSADATDMEDESENGPDDAQYCIRVFRADSTFATLSCKLSSSVTEVLGLLGRKSFLQDNLANYQIVMRKNGLLRILGPNERPLKIQKRLLEQAGYTEEDHLDEIGREDHGYLVRFTFMMVRTGGYSLDQDPGLNKMQKFDKVDLKGCNLLTIPILLYHKAPEIISLNLSNNLSLNIPKDFIQQCSTLRQIEFCGNEAERLPNSIIYATRLTFLNVSNNRLEDMENVELDSFRGLITLNLSNNRFATLPNRFGQLKSLRVLYLASNRLTAFPMFICDLVTLVDLDLSFNSIKSFPLEIGQLSALERLTVANNCLTGSLPATFSNLTSLKELDLRFNYELQNIDVLSELPRLEAVVISHNRISAYQLSFKKLVALHLNSNPVTRFNLTTVLPTLTFLNLSNAKIAGLNEALFDKVPCLERLVLDGNHIVSFPPQIAKLRNLYHLSCNHNELATIPKEIGLLHELRFLDLHYNNIKSLPGEIWQMLNLVSLNVSSNNLKEFPKPITSNAPGGIAAAEPASSREKVIPGNTNTEGWDESVANPATTGGRRLSQQSNGLLTAGAASPNGYKGSTASIQGARRGSTVSKIISDSASTTAPTIASRKDSSASGKFSNTFITHLKYLHLADNRLSDECFEELSLLGELRVLNLSYNDLYEIPSRALGRMPNLAELYLSGNELTSLPAEDLEAIPNLKVLHLNGNKFQTLPAELGKIRKLLVLDVGNNALKYNISNWPYDWNWNWNLDLKYLNLSGNKRLEIKPSRNENNAGREKSITDFSQLKQLRILGLMDVTLMITNIPDGTEDRRVRLSGSMIRSMHFGMADCLGRNEHLSLVDMVIPDFRGDRDEWLVGLFDGQSLPNSGSKIAKFLHEHVEFFLKDELGKLRPDESPIKALRRTFLNLNKELATTAAQALEDKGVGTSTRNLSSSSNGMNAATLAPHDMESGGVATIVYMTKNKLFVANVGDAMAVLTYTDGTHRSLTKKHDPGVAPELDRVREAGGYVSRMGKLNEVLSTSRAFGYFPHMPAINAAPDIQEVNMEGHEEILILANRELWEFISFQSAVDIARTEKADLMRAANRLRDMAIAYGATDKLMVMVLGVGDIKKPRRFPRAHSTMSPGEEELPTVKVTRKRGKDPEKSQFDRFGGEVKAPDGDLAIVFTDIKNSTLMWETYPVAMRSGIRVHNNIMRRQLRQVGGYEVKTEGDAFMVSFPTATSALLWCFNVQQLLLEQEWPDEILDSEGGREIVDSEGRVIYKGLSVRMGIHWGSPVCEPDPITGRMDYFGPMVNRAARISGEADGGQITVSSDFDAELQRCLTASKLYNESDQSNQKAEEIFGDVDVARTITKDVKELNNKGYTMTKLGERKLKGLENPEVIHLVYPNVLAGRLEEKSAQKAVAQQRHLSINPDDIWALWDISLRLELVCSSLNTSDKTPLLKLHTLDMTQKLKGITGQGASDQVMMQLFEHCVTRIENCMTVLYLRRMLTPDPNTKTVIETASPLISLLDTLAASLGLNIKGSWAASEEAKAAQSGFIEDESSAVSTISSSSSSTAVSPTTATPSRSSRGSYILNTGSPTTPTHPTHRNDSVSE